MLLYKIGKFFQTSMAHIACKLKIRKLTVHLNQANGSIQLKMRKNLYGNHFRNAHVWRLYVLSLPVTMLSIRLVLCGMATVTINTIVRIRYFGTKCCFLQNNTWSKISQKSRLFLNISHFAYVTCPSHANLICTHSHLHMRG